MGKLELTRMFEMGDHEMVRRFQKENFGYQIKTRSEPGGYHNQVRASN
jgi:hypothetical protein